MKRFIAVLLILAILSGCGPSREPTPGAESLVQEAGTGDTGQATFTDPTTGEEVIVTVVDADGQPLPGLTVVYEHGVAYPYEAFFVANDQDVIVGVDFYLNNSDHEIVVEPNVMRRANPDQARAIAGYVGDLGKRSRDFYQKTISCDEYASIMDNLETAVHIELHALLVFFGVHAVPANKVEWEGGQEPCTGQWDWYHAYSAHAGRTETMVLVQSQPPVMTGADVSVDEQGVFHATWSAEDRSEYPERPTYKIDLLDHTIFLGRTEFSDLDFHYRVIDAQDQPVVDWTDTAQTEAAFGPLAIRTYQLEVYCTDEVANASGVWREQVTISRLPSEPEPGVPQQCQDERPRAYSWDVYSTESPVVTDTAIHARFELDSPETFPADRPPIIVFLLGQPLVSHSPTLDAAEIIGPESDDWVVILTFLAAGTYYNYLDLQSPEMPWKVDKVLMGIPHSLGDNRYEATLRVEEPARDLLLEYVRWAFLFQEDTCIWMSSPVRYER